MSWFKNQIYAPGFYTGYGVKTIPAVREAIEQGKWQLAETSIETVGKVLQNEADRYRCRHHRTRKRNKVDQAK